MRQRAQVVPAARGRVLVIARKGGLGGEIRDSLERLRDKIRDAGLVAYLGRVESYLE